jgi:hypothetical protein
MYSLSLEVRTRVTSLGYPVLFADTVSKKLFFTSVFFFLSADIGALIFRTWPFIVCSTRRCGVIYIRIFAS